MENENNEFKFFIIQVIFLIFLIILINYQINYNNQKKKNCKNISGIYTLEQYDLIFRYNHKININLLRMDSCKFKITNVKIRSLLDIYYEKSEYPLEAYITILNNELVGGKEILYEEKVNNTLNQYSGYFNNNNIFIKKNDNDIIIFKGI